LATWFNTSLDDVKDFISAKLIKAVIAQRLIKTPLEVAEMEKAVSISVDMMMAVIQHTRPGLKEYNQIAKAHETANTKNAGIRYKDIHLAACQKLVEGLIQVNLMKGDPAEAVAAGAHTMFFQCGLGHMLGMDTHDMEDLGEPYVGYTDTLKKEMSIFGLKSL